MDSKKKVGKPIEWTDEKINVVFDDIIDRMCEGELISEILRVPKGEKAPEGLPRYSTFMQWITDREELADKYARAREIQADAEFDELRKIADTPMMGKRIESGVDKDGNKFSKVIEEDMTAHRKLMYDARKFRIGKMASKYNDKVDVNLNKKTSLSIHIDLSDDDDEEGDDNVG